MKKAYKTGVGVAVTAALLSGCSDPEIRYVEKIVHLPPTQEQIQKAVDEALEKMAKENAELKLIAQKIKADDPTLVSARYDYDENGEKALVLVHAEDNGGSGVMSYAVPLMAGALVTSSALELAEELVEAKSKYRLQCERNRGHYNKKDDTCDNPYISSYSGHSRYVGNPYYSSGTSYSDFDSYKTTAKKRNRDYQSQSAKKVSAANLSKQLRDKNKALAKAKAKNQSIVKKSATSSPNKKATLSTSKSVFKKKSSSRSSSMRWGG